MELSHRRAFLQHCAAAVPFSWTTAAWGTATFTAPDDAARREFSFIHLSDSHLEPRHAGSPFNRESRSIQTLEWIARRSAEPVVQEPYRVTAQPPAFAIHTGDVFEYSLVDQTWDDLEISLAEMACPVCFVAGNHDNTWGEINGPLRRRFGGDNFSFDYGDCHFICLNSAGLLEPLPYFDRAALDWLRADLARTPVDRLLFVALHHPLSGNAGYASEFEKLRFWDLLQGRRVALMMDGHWHIVHCQQWQQIDRVNGGATFGPHTGYNTITVHDGVLRVMFQYEDASPEGEKLIPLVEKPLDDVTATPVVDVTVQPVSGDEQAIAVAVSPVERGVVRAWIDGASDQKTRLRKRGGARRGRLSTEALIPGWHFVTAQVTDREAASRIDYAQRFRIAPREHDTLDVREVNVGAGVKARPVTSGECIVVASTAGRVVAYSNTLEECWRYEARSQVVHGLTAVGNHVLVGDIAGVLHCLDARDGRLQWKHQAPQAIYAAPAVDGEKVYVADGWGSVYALGLADGQHYWSRRPAKHAIEAQPLVRDGMLYFGAWDALVYALETTTGELRWKSWCPTGHEQTESRYYGAADCPLVAIDETLFACDRGYRLGAYHQDGEFQRVLGTDIAAVGLDAVGTHLLAKGLQNELSKLDREGAVVWQVETPAGRIVTPPVEVEGRVAVLSDTGTLSLHDSEDGALITRYSVSPQLYCLSGIGVDREGALVTADVDGLVTQLAWKN